MPMPDQSLSPKDYAIACWMLVCEHPEEFKPKQDIHTRVVSAGLTDLLDFEEYKVAVPSPLLAMYALYLGQHHNSMPYDLLLEVGRAFNKVHKYKAEVTR